MSLQNPTHLHFRSASYEQPNRLIDMSGDKAMSVQGESRELLHFEMQDSRVSGILPG